MTSPKHSLWEVGKAIVKAVAVDGDQTEISAQVHDQEGGSVRATLDITVSEWQARASASALTPDDAVRNCLVSLEWWLRRRELSSSSPSTARALVALSSCLLESGDLDPASSALDVGLAPTIPPPAMRPTVPLAPPDRVAAMRRLIADALGGLTRARGLWSELSQSEKVEVLRTASNEASRLIGAL